VVAVLERLDDVLKKKKGSRRIGKNGTVYIQRCEAWVETYHDVTRRVFILQY